MTSCPLRKSRGVDAFIGGVFNSGVLAAPALKRHLRLRRRVRRSPQTSKTYRRGLRRVRRAPARGGDPFPAQPSGGELVLLGMNTPEPVRQNFEWFSTAIPSALWTRLREEGLIRKDAPTLG
jgi:D-threo-aldose 1-dehydrogenase